MLIAASGILARGVAGTDRSTLTFPAVVCLTDGTLLATWRSGSTKDAADETIELARSRDHGRTWSDPVRPFPATMVSGHTGTLKVCYITETAPRTLLAACMWVDRQSYPGQPLFNAETEGCLPMAILLANSSDNGHSWDPLRPVPLPGDVGPPSLTNPILTLHDGSLGMSIETNKEYLDRNPWRQRVLLFRSRDGGLTWGDGVIAGQDPLGRIFNWDQRAGVAPDGRIVTYLWTYDRVTQRYLNIHRRLSGDSGHTWSAAVDLGFPDQAAHPAILADGRVVLAWVDRFQTRSIRARMAPAVDAMFEPASEVEIYRHGSGGQGSGEPEETGDLLAEMSLWTFGLPYAETLADGDALVVYYAGTDQVLDLHWCRLRINAS